MRRFIFFVLALWGASVGRTPLMSDFLPAEVQGSNPSQMWRYFMRTDCGVRIYVNYALIRVPVKGNKIALDLSVHNFLGKNHSVGREYQPEQLQLDSAKPELNIIDHFIMSGVPWKNGHRILFDAKKGLGYKLDVVFHEVKSPIMANPTEVIPEGLGANYAVLMPFGKFKGSLIIANDTLKITGVGYADKMEQSELAGRWVHQSLNVFWWDSVQNKGFAGRVLAAQGRSEPTGYLLVWDASGMRVARPEVRAAGRGFYSSAPAASYTMPLGGQWGEVTWERDDFQVFSPLVNLDNWLQRKVVTSFMGGEANFHRGAPLWRGYPLEYELYRMK
jgi:hypothetical protein